MKECFCGCGRTIPRLPLGVRSINKRGMLVSERLAWSIAVLPESGPNLEDWINGGHQIIYGLRQAMHGQSDPRSLDEGYVRGWMKPGQQIEKQAVSDGVLSINQWLKQDPAARDLVIAVASGKYEPEMTYSEQIAKRRDS